MRIGYASVPTSGGVTAGNRIDTANIDGSDTLTVKTFTNRTVGFPRWSPDGRKIAFLDYSRNSGDMLALYVMNSDGSNERFVGWSMPVAKGLDWYDDSVHLLCVQQNSYPQVINVDTLSVPWSGRNLNLDEMNLPVGASRGGAAINAQWFNPLPADPAAPPLTGLRFIYNERSVVDSGAPNGSRSYLSMNTQTGVSLPSGAPNPTTPVIAYDGGVYSGTQLIGSLVAVAPQRDGFVYFLWHVPDNADALYHPTGLLLWQPVNGSAVALPLYADASSFAFSPDQTLVAINNRLYRWLDVLQSSDSIPSVGTALMIGHWHFAAA